MMTQVFVKSAKNAEVWDMEGSRYIDFAGGIAVENAIKIARAATGRNGVIGFYGGGGYGRTFMGMSLIGKITPYKKDFGTLMHDVYYVPLLVAF